MTASHEYWYWCDKFEMLTNILDAGGLSSRAYDLILKFYIVPWGSYDIRPAKQINSKKAISRAAHCEVVSGKFTITCTYIIDPIIGGGFNSFFLDYVSSHLINDAPGKYKHFRKKIMIISWKYDPTLRF